MVIICSSVISGFLALHKVSASFNFALLCGAYCFLVYGYLFVISDPDHDWHRNLSNFGSFRFFSLVPVSEFLLGLTWNPQFEGAERAGSGQMGLTTDGSIPLFLGTFLISVIPFSFAVPIGPFSAIYLSEYATQRARSIMKPLMEVLAGISTVVYGFLPL